MPSDEYLWRARIANEWADTKAVAKRAEAAEARVAELLAERAAIEKQRDSRHPAPREDVEALIRAADILYPTAIEEWKSLREALARVKAELPAAESES